MTKNPSTPAVSQPEPPAPAVSLTTLLGLHITTTLATMLALYQWMELLISLEGGSVICDMGGKLDCSQVWNSAFAKGLQKVSMMPVAGWGLIWGLVSLITVMILWSQVAKGQKVGQKAVFMVRLCAAVGVLTSIALLGIVLQLGTFCLTCIGTYIITLVFIFFAWKLPGPWILPMKEMTRAGFGTLGIVILLYLVLLVPGMRTPLKPASGLRPPTDGTSMRPAPSSMTPLEAFLRDQTPQVRQGISNFLGMMKSAPARDTSGWAVRHMEGPQNAPVKLVDFTDIRCGHCRTLAEVLTQIERIAPSGAFSVESRHFPLDSECNPNMKGSDGKGVRCAAARALICLEDSKSLKAAHMRMFEEQERLTKDRVLEIAAESSGMTRQALESCMASKATEEKLKSDMDYAMLYDPEGTPLVLINGRKVMPMPEFLLAVILANGNVNAPEFTQLPPPSLPMGP